MHTFFYADHGRHNPGQYNQDNDSIARRYWEVPQRADLIAEAIRTADLGPIISPGDFGIEPIAEIHDYGLISLLQNGFRLLRDSNLSQPFLADTFAVYRQSHHKPRSVLGLLGYYSFDSWAPILDHTWEVAYWGVQAAVSAAALVLAGSDQVAYALSRPPGHHAAHNSIGGFCYLNNAAIAANWLVQQGQRVAIIDIDYHHGNGTQAIFYGRSDVMVCSLHADPFVEYPFHWGYADEYGEGAGRNHNFNYPLPLNVREEHYLQALDQALAKVRLFVPDIVILSLGYDLLQGDPQGGFQMPVASLTAIGDRFRTLALPFVIVQEGGYNLDTLAASTVAFFQGLLGR